MFVEISNDATVVREPADLKSLSVRVQAGAHLASGVHGLGEVAEGGEHVWLHIPALKASAAAALPADLPADEQAAWAQGFDGMIAYATSKGWTNTEGTAVRAHVEP